MAARPSAAGGGGPRPDRRGAGRRAGRAEREPQVGQARRTPQAAPETTPHSVEYWKEHRDLWPVGTLSLGDQSYAEKELWKLVKKKLKLDKKSGLPRDASQALAKQLIATKLNVANGSPWSCVSAQLSAADNQLSGYGRKLLYAVGSGTVAGQAMLSTAGLLESYNAGTLQACLAPPTATWTLTPTPTDIPGLTQTPTPTDIPGLTQTPTWTISARSSSFPG